MAKLFKRGGIYYAWVKCADGEWRKRSTGCRDKEAARRTAAKWERIEADPSHVAAQTTTVRDALERMIADREERGRSAATVSFYTQKAGHVLRVLGENTPLAAIGPREVDQYIKDRFAEGATRHTLTKELTTLRVTLRLARRRGEYHLHHEDVMPIGWESGYRPGERALSVDEAKALVANMTKGREQWPAFALLTGARAAECEAAQAVDLDLDAGLCLLRGNKTERAWRTIPIITSVVPGLDWLLDYVSLPLRAWSDSPRAKGFARACRRAEIEYTTLRDCRRTAGTWLREAVGDSSLVSRWLGHSTPYLTERVYARLEGESLAGALRNQSRSR